MPNPIQVRWTIPAANDLLEITRFIRKDNPSAAISVAQTLFEAANSLDNFPSRGRLGRISGTRELVISGLPYIVVYQIEVEAILILHIYHGARNWPA
jgi:toxin ParE1/3/4